VDGADRVNPSLHHSKNPDEVDGADRVNPSLHHLAAAVGDRDLLASHRLLQTEMGVGARRLAQKPLPHAPTIGVVLAMLQEKSPAVGGLLITPTLVADQCLMPEADGVRRLLLLLLLEDRLEDGVAQEVMEGPTIALAGVGDDEMETSHQTEIFIVATQAVPSTMTAVEARRMTAVIKSGAEKTSSGEEANETEFLTKKQDDLKTIQSADASILLRRRPQRPL